MNHIILLVLFITVYLACWIPHWLNDVGLVVPLDVERMFVQFRRQSFHLQRCQRHVSLRRA